MGKLSSELKSLAKSHAEETSQKHAEAMLSYMRSKAGNGDDWPNYLTGELSGSYRIWRGFKPGERFVGSDLEYMPSVEFGHDGPDGEAVEAKPHLVRALWEYS